MSDNVSNLLDPRRWAIQKQPPRVQLIVSATVLCAVIAATWASATASPMTWALPVLSAAVIASSLIGLAGEKRRLLFAHDAEQFDLLNIWWLVAVLTLPPRCLTIYTILVCLVQYFALPRRYGRLHKHAYSSATFLLAAYAGSFAAHYSPWLALIAYCLVQQALIALVMLAVGAPLPAVLNQRRLLAEWALAAVGVVVAPLGVHLGYIFLLIVLTTALQQLALHAALLRACAHDGLIRDRAWVHEANTAIGGEWPTAVIVFACGQQNRAAAAIIAHEARKKQDWVTIRPEGVHLFTQGIAPADLRIIVQRHIHMLAGSGIRAAVGWASAPKDGTTLDDLTISALCVLAADEAAQQGRVGA